jgi:glycosyltransferase involved in cell wall biosynthesis
MLRKIIKAAARMNIYLKKKPRLLGVLLCYNDADILRDAIDALLKSKHEIIVWDHGSDDETKKVLDSFGKIFVERKFIPRSFDFYQLYPAMSENIIKNYSAKYDWVSWPDQDEILEGPSRSDSYFDYLCEVFNSPFHWIQFNNFNFWYTEKDRPDILSPVERIKHYCLFPDCAPRVRSWRASKTNIRVFNHNSLEGKRYPSLFNLRHYPMRSEAQMLKRVYKDRSGLKRENQNYHYENMKQHIEKMQIKSNHLHCDNGAELKMSLVYNWREIYGY